MLSKNELRAQLSVLPLDEALSLAIKETSFWDVLRFQNFTGVRDAILMIASFHPVEAAGLLCGIPPLTSHLFFGSLEKFLVEPETARTSLQEWGIHDTRSERYLQNLNEVLRLFRILNRKDQSL